MAARLEQADRVQQAGRVEHADRVGRADRANVAAVLPHMRSRPRPPYSPIGWNRLRSRARRATLGAMTSAVTSPRLSDTGDHAFDWALVDVETSGLRPGQDRVLSVAVVTLGPHGERTGEFSMLLNPGCDPGPVHVHGLTAERLRGAPTFDQVAGRIGAMLRDRVMVAHNAEFDYDFLAHEFARARLCLSD